MQLRDIDGKYFLISKGLVRAALKKFGFVLCTTNSEYLELKLFYRGKQIDNYILEYTVMYRMLENYSATKAMRELRKVWRVTLVEHDAFMGVSCFLVTIKRILREELKERKRKGAQEWAHANAVKEAKQRTEAFDKELAALRKRIAALEIARGEYALESYNTCGLDDQVRAIRERLASHRMRMIDKM